MHDERSAGTLTNAALDAEIARALNIAPSGDFIAHVRTRVAEESPRGGKYPAWPLAAALFVAAIVMLPLLRSANRGIESHAPLISRSDVRGLPLPHRAPSHATAPEPAIAPADHPRSVRVPKEPEVLILARDRIALYELVRAINTGRVSPTIVVDATPVSMTAADPESGTIQPLVIEPLAVSAGEQGERR